ncbi:histidine phosphatase family protein [Aestuariimicrobium kwangyangense]|uniref:histidine phosphatase family protein n=1 Tax=Aestuariimicrobium kwangyangense TaxID=396389 RepID=UPI0003B46C81|nr:histidine phosphatase family protein [Aestuariimicrobium kwangyangense]
MQLLIIRHGQSANNVAMEASLGEDGRVADPALTDLGRRQAEAVGRWIVDHGPHPERIHTSLMRRTIETAAPLAHALGVPVEPHRDLFESGGVFEGAYLDRVAGAGSPGSVLSGLAHEVVLPPGVDEDGWYRAEVESAQQVCQRALALVDWLRATDESCVALVIHGAIGSVLMSALLHPEPVRELAQDPAADAAHLPLWFRLDNTSVSLLELVGDEQVEVDWINRIDHLAGLEHQVSRTHHRFPPAFSG